MKKKDPRLFEIADWRNHATENECAWIRYIWAWYDRTTLQPLRLLGLSKALSADLCKSHDIFTVVTSGPEELSEDEKRKRQEESKGWIDPSTGKPYVEPPEPVGPFIDEHSVFRNDPPLSGKARKKIIEILPTALELWEEGLLHRWKKIPDKREELSFDKWLERALLDKRDKREEGLDAYLNHPRLRQCSNPECKKWFVVSKTDQMFCQTPASDRPVNSRTGKPSPPCRIVAYQRTEEYKKRTAAKMTKWRKNKDKKQLVEVRPAEPVQKPPSP